MASSPDQDRPTALFDSIHGTELIGGGQRRTLQIITLAQRAGFDVAHVSVANQPGFRNRVYTGIAATVRCRLPVRPSVDVLRELGTAVLAYRHHLEEAHDPRVVLWEMTRDGGMVLPTIAGEYGVAVVACPQNLESLVPGQTDRVLGSRSIPKALEIELTQLARADLVICISREEQWLLNAFGIAADFLPYFPTPEIEFGLLAVRRMRLDVTPKRVLVLGSAGNPPVREGLLQLLQRLLRLRGRFPHEVHLAGNDTHQLRQQLDLGSITVHGAVAMNRLHELMASSDAAIVFQARGSGALTRIPELLLAGVRVISNAHAARSAQHYDGVEIFETDEELVSLLNRRTPIPTAPSRPVQAEERLIQRLRGLGQVSTATGGATALQRCS
jgi:hypothetical protein